MFRWVLQRMVHEYPHLCLSVSLVGAETVNLIQILRPNHVILFANCKI
jgi:hypothetical protein